MMLRKWKALTALFAVLLAGCGGQERQSASPPAVAAPAVAARDAEGVVLDQASQREVGVVVRSVEIRALPEVIRSTGRVTINENDTWRVGAVTAGRIVELFATEGDSVEQGQILANIYCHDVHEARAEYRLAAAELNRLKAALAYATSLRDRTKRLYRLKAASLQQVEQAEAEYFNAETAVANGEVELERTRSHLVEFLGGKLEVNAEETTESGFPVSDLVPITAPAAGTLLSRNVTTGTVVEPSADLFVITDLSTLWMMAAVSEDYLSKLRVGMPVAVSVQAYPDRVFRGRLTKLGTELDPTTRTIMARVDVPNHGGLLKPEMYAIAEMELSDTREAIFVPEVAIQEVNGQDAVFVRTAPDRFESRTVNLSPGAGGNVEIVSGLRAGEEVAVEGSFLLKSQLMKSSLAEE